MEEIENEYVDRLVESILTAFDEDSPNYINTGLLKTEEEQRKFLEALLVIVPNVVSNLFTTKETKMSLLETNHFANGLICSM